ncbi:hypothetical protein OUZ56_029740 [Daphnia magna]|uniref:Uncharacterized protein n=1 Tax=Daphnia magna TaxID=35525 RepID=A0ABR0B7P9_9CRUS|nr:hypothetical protein OUZ56_029740 [Daphnia magna]
MMLSIRGKVSERFGEEEHETYLKIVCDSDHGGLATGGPVGVALALKKPPATPLVLKYNFLWELFVVKPILFDLTIVIVAQNFAKYKSEFKTGPT